ncbi:MAG: class I SAM-dependent methyltransferase [Candidatus Pacebacteria bacterium]|nr:class I SAM-dependent methyltransferase [Candidatus Paceibacterota bacterium]
MKAKNFVQRIKERNRYATNRREPFYDLAGKYLPKDKDKIVIDIGSGYGFFADYLKLRDKFKNTVLLDADPEVVGKIKNSINYKAPDKLPFENNSVAYIHCSHLIEHLETKDFFILLREMDRVLAQDGVLILSAPLLDYMFYEGLAHIRPYGPEGIIHYMCKKDEKEKKKTIAGADGGFVSDKYVVEDLVYRYVKNLGDSELGSRFLIISIGVAIIKKIFSKLGFYKYSKNGFTLILRKQ